jgi:hypothetical protein
LATKRIIGQTAVAFAFARLLGLSVCRGIPQSLVSLEVRSHSRFGLPGYQHRQPIGWRDRKNTGNFMVGATLDGARISGRYS